MHCSGLSGVSQGCSLTWREKPLRGCFPEHECGKLLPTHWLCSDFQALRVSVKLSFFFPAFPTGMSVRYLVFTKAELVKAKCQFLGRQMLVVFLKAAVWECLDSAMKVAWQRSYRGLVQNLCPENQVGAGAHCGTFHEYNFCVVPGPKHLTPNSTGSEFKTPPSSPLDTVRSNVSSFSWVMHGKSAKWCQRCQKW